MSLEKRNEDLNVVCSPASARGHFRLMWPEEWELNSFPGGVFRCCRSETCEAQNWSALKSNLPWMQHAFKLWTHSCVINIGGKQVSDYFSSLIFDAFISPFEILLWFWLLMLITDIFSHHGELKSYLFLAIKLAFGMITALATLLDAISRGRQRKYLEKAG